MPSIRRAEADIFKHQADATLSQAPVSGTKYTVLDTTKNARIISISVRCTWTVQPTPLEVHMTIDGQALTFTFTDPVSDQWYDAAIGGYGVPTAQPLFTVGHEKYRAFLLEGRSVKVEAEITGGTVSNLSSKVKYAKIP